MRRIRLDKIDRRILRDLQATGRMTNVELARRAGISAPPSSTQMTSAGGRGFPTEPGRRTASPLGIRQ